MASFNETEMVALAIVATNSQSEGDGLSAADVLVRYPAPYHVDHIDAALRHFEACGLMSRTGAGEMSEFKTTKAGQDFASAMAVEITKMREKILRREIASLAQTGSAPKVGASEAIDWTKWGTLIAGLALAVTIIIAVVS